ncbi:hypothetical protein AB6A40_004522 [Gnathostoma spinigerum]|uniref:Uncharacterized protein n=1 Tax=Gnathostoma spinigerum TaxID=75299 RepID=A0ABD6ECR2_9BILA
MGFSPGNEPNAGHLKGLVERGHAILAEINRLCDSVPDDFIDPSKSKFRPLLIDFCYFDDLTVIDKFIESNENGSQLEDEFFFTFDRAVNQFGALFDAIARFLADIIDVSERIVSEKDILTIRLCGSTLLEHQLQAESLYLTGVTLLALDERFSCPVRQRLFVAHYRSNPSSNERFDLLVDVLKATTSDRCEFFRRLPLNASFIDNIVGLLRSVNLFPDDVDYLVKDVGPERSVSKVQRAMLTVCLFFAPSILQNQITVMRQIIDAYFVDNWVVPVHLGMIVNVVDAWDRYKAAYTVIHQVLTIPVIKQLASTHVLALRSISYPSLAELPVAAIIPSASLVSSANHHLRWIILHSYKSDKCCKKASYLCDTVAGVDGVTSLEIFKFLLETANFEAKYKEVCKNTIESKKSKSDILKQDLMDSLSQLATLFENDLPLQKIRKNPKLREWLLLVKDTVADINIENPETSSVLKHLMKRINQVSDMHDLAGNVTLSQYLQTVMRILEELDDLTIVKETLLQHVDAACDFSYAWNIVDQWQPAMEKLVEHDPIPIRSLFLKLSSSIGSTLVSIETPSLVSTISMCYSRQLESRLRKILQAIPRSVFSMMEKVINLLDTPIGSAINKAELRQFADPERRLKLAEITNSISAVSLGVSTMQLTWIGSMRINPSSLLVDGIKRELVMHIVASFHSELSSANDLSTALSNLKTLFGRFRRAFVYMCEYMSINGALLWRSEMARVIGYMVEKECNKFLHHEITDGESLYQSKVAPIPQTTPIKGATTPVGRLFQFIICASDPRTTFYSQSLETWSDSKTSRCVLSSDSFSAIEESLSPLALSALDRVSCFSVVKLLYSFLTLVTSCLSPNLMTSVAELRSLNDYGINDRIRRFENAITKMNPTLSAFLSVVSKIGQLQLLRLHMTRVVEESVKRRAGALFSAVSNLNASILNDIRSGCGSCDESLLSELSELLDRCAITEPLRKVYIRKKTPEYLVEFLTVLFASSLSRLNGGRKSEWTDGSAFCAGLACILNQFNCVDSFLSLCATLTVSINSQPKCIPEVVKTEILPRLRLIATYCHLNPKRIDELIETPHLHV